MTSIFYPSGANLGTRNSNNGFVETLIAVSPNIVLYFDSGSNINNISASLFYITASNSVSSSYSATASYMDTNLQGWWKFNDGSGSGVTDSSIYKRHGVIIGSGYSWITNSYVGSNSSALSLTPSSYVSFGTKIHMLGDMSLSIWLKYITNPSNYAGIFGCYQQGQPGVLLYLDSTNTNITLEVSDGTNTAYVGSNNSITSSWHHFVATVDRTLNTMSMYVDSVFQGTVICSSVGYNESTTQWVVNSRNDGGYNNKGTMYVDDARIYSRVLSQADVTALYSAGPQ